MVFFLTSLMQQKERLKKLERLLPICSYCKKIRDDSGKDHGQGEWITVEKYISQLTDTDLTHGICPECHKKVMAEIKSRAEEKHGKI